MIFSKLAINMQEILEPLVKIFWEYLYQPWINIFLYIIVISFAGFVLNELHKNFKIDLLETIWLNIKKKLGI